LKHFKRAVGRHLPGAVGLLVPLLMPAALGWAAEGHVSQSLEPDDQGAASRVGYNATRPLFGGPTSPEGEIEETDRTRTPAFTFPAIYESFAGWRDWKRALNDEHGLQLSAHYSTLFQRLDESLGGEDKASGGVARVTAKWTALGRDSKNQGSLIVTLDHRHAFRDVAPADLAGEAGYIGVTGLFFSDTDFSVINLNWQQGLNEGRSGFVAGRYDPNDYMNVMGMVNPWTMFSNLASSLDLSVALPDSSWGIGGGHWMNDQWYVLGGINDANGTGTDDLEFFDGGAEFFTYAHLGWSPSKGERYFKNVHALAWHVDEREDLDIEESHGVAFAANWTFAERWMPFVRLGFSEGSAPIYNESATLGMIYKLEVRSDLLGIAVNWGDPPAAAFREQTTLEAFWRFQLAQNLAITPSVQWLQNPALNSEEDEVWVIGLRTRLTF
jgi:porin